MRRLASILVLLAASASAQSNWYVSPAGNDASAGTNWATAKSNLQSLVQSFSATSTNDVWLATGDYAMAGTQLLMTNAQRTRIIGTNREATRLIGPGAPFNVVTMNSTNQWLIGLTITGGASTNRYGGGVGGGSGLGGNVSNCVVVSNICYYASSYGGGGVYNVRIYDSVVERNSSGAGGGGGQSIEAWRTIFRHNAATNGVQGAGGGVNNGFLYGCDVISNSASAGGGGVSATYAEGCLIANNYAAGVGGGAKDGSLRGGIVESNESASTSGGGGIGNGSSTGTVVRFNVAPSCGGGVRSGVHAFSLVSSNGLSGSDTTGSQSYYGTFYSCVFAGSRHPALEKEVPISHLVAMYNCTIVGFTNAYHKVFGPAATPYFNNICFNAGTNSPSTITNAGFNYTNDPAFLGDPAFPYKLAQGSPCIDAGNNAYVGTALDFYGRLRQVNGTVDIGAVEYQTDGSDAPSISGRRSFFWSLLLGG